MHQMPCVMFVGWRVEHIRCINPKMSGAFSEIEFIAPSQHLIVHVLILNGLTSIVFIYSTEFAALSDPQLKRLENSRIEDYFTGEFCTVD